MADLLRGIIPALLTPLTPDGLIDAEGLNRLLEEQLIAGVGAIFLAGMTGEGASLTQEQLVTLFREAKKTVKDRVPLCVGVLHGSTERVIELARVLIEQGACCLSALPPYAMPGADQEQIIRHFQLLCSRTCAKWMIYGNAGCYPNIKPETMRALGQLENIIAIKDTRPDFEGHLRNLMATADVDVALLSGGEYLVGPGLLMGAKGNISGATNLYPKLFVRLYDAAVEKDVDTVNRLAREIALIHSTAAASGAHWLAAFKYMAERSGLMGSACTSPIPPVPPQAARVLDELLEKMSCWRG